MEMAREWEQIVRALFVALIMAWGGWAAARATGKANVKVSDSDNRVQMEKEAYERARKLDTETIERQDKEMNELRAENTQLKEDNRALHAQVERLELRISRMEREFSNLKKEDFDEQF